MRDIKVRAWDKQNKKMCIDNVQVLQCILNIYMFKGKHYEHFIFMEYTGKKDKTNKIELFESDIILIEDEWTDVITDDGRGPTDPFNHLRPIEFENGAFGVFLNGEGNFFERKFYTFSQIEECSGQTEFEKIGDKFRNPELIK